MSQSSTPPVPTQRPLLIAVLFGILGVVAVLDYVTGGELSFAIFYILPIAAIAWEGSLTLAILSATIATALWFAIDAATQHYSVPIIVAWNGSVRGAIFLLTAIGVHHNRRLLRLAEALSRTDPLTGLYNSRALLEYVDRELSRTRRYGGSVALAFVDLDRFKGVNDRFGHEAGDGLLQGVADTLNKSVRETDLVSRVGGDEFVVMLTENDETQLQGVVERLRQDLNAFLQESDVGAAIGVTASIGIARSDASTASATKLIKDADLLMYQAKQQGRNQVVFEPVSHEQ